MTILKSKRLSALKLSFNYMTSTSEGIKKLIAPQEERLPSATPPSSLLSKAKCWVALASGCIKSDPSSYLKKKEAS